MMSLTKLSRILIAASSLLFAMTIEAAVTPQITQFEQQSQNQQINLKWHVDGLKSQRVQQVDIMLDGNRIPAASNLEPDRGQAVCYLLMVDTSKSMLSKGKKTKANSRKQLVDMLLAIANAKPQQHYLGLMSFSKQATMLSKPQQSIDELLVALTDLKFDQSRTELYRFIESGVNQLTDCPDSYRQVLILLSDGLSEDQSYSNQDALAFARKHKVAIYSLVIKDSDSLQNPIYLAEKSGGWGAEPAQLQGVKLKNTIASLYGDSNSGGEATLDVSAITAHKKAELQLTLSDGKTVTRSIDLNSENTSVPLWQQPMILGIAGGVLGLLLLLWLLLGRKSKKSDKSSQRIVQGYLIHQGESHPIYYGINRLGFLPDNDIVINDDTVGRAHATLHYQGEGDVVLTDLSSLNGSWVNDERIERPMALQDGDKVAFGNWEAVYQQAEK